MLSQDWEPFADSLAAAPTADRLLEVVAEFAGLQRIEFDGGKVEVLVGRDTRPSGPSLLEAAKLVWFLFFVPNDLAKRLVEYLILKCKIRNLLSN